MEINTKTLFLAIRPHTLPASQAPIILGLAYTYSTTKQLNLSVALLTALVALLLQISTNLVNDLYDAKKGIDGPDRLGPTRVTQQGLLTTTQVTKLIILSFSLAFILVLPLLLHGGITMLLLTTTCFLAAFLYTGGPYPLSYYALGELFAFIFFGPLAVWGVVYLQTLHYSINPLFIGIPLGVISAQIMSINNTRDRTTDRQKGKKTIATLLPNSMAQRLPQLFLVLSLVLPVLIRPSTLSLLPLLAAIPFLSKWKILWQPTVSSRYNEALAATGKYMFIYSIFFSVTLLL